jgi:spore germination cell wall hydrolase CwlJ-like protein
MTSLNHPNDMNASILKRPALAWRSLPREAAISLAVAAAGLVALGGTVAAMPLIARDEPALAVEKSAMAALPQTDATQLRDVSPEEAIALNAKLPILAAPAGAAKPFDLGNASVDSRAQALECLTSALYYESGQESDDGQKAVAQVILNRVRHPAYPSSVCGVVYQGSTRQTGCQFTFTCDGSLGRTPMTDAWARARRNALAMLEGAVYAPVGNATHYHANYVLPYWASTLTKTQVVGAHLFYRWSGNWGRPGAFNQRYAGREANASALRRAALAVPHVLPKALAAGNPQLAKLDAQPGVELTKDKGGRMTMRFEAARVAVEKVAIERKPYVEQVKASDNLKFALDGAASGASEQPAFGKSAAN